jgi:hypothetical protein
MKCPFRTKVTVTKDYKTSTYGQPKDITEKSFEECYKELCMAYDRKNLSCKKIGGE